ncbi:MAG: CapA family protein [Deltaproteobacteria bacterium]|nr:CapA family protein [Deltaproteobacteria bacterium]
MRIDPKNKRSGWKWRVGQGVLVAVGLVAVCIAAVQACRTLPHRDEAPPLTIAAVGDTYAHGEWFSGQDPLEEIRSLLDEEDVFIFNMEGVLLSKDPPAGACRTFPNQSRLWSPSSVADFLHPTRRTVATMGNNHILDCGALGIRETLHELVGRGILTVGAGENADSACRPLTFQANGIRLAILSYLSMNPDRFSAGSDRAGAASWETCPAESAITRMAAEADLVIVALHLHMGQGWTERSPSEHIALAQRALDAGAHIVIGHGPHVPQGILVGKGGVAFLSLGNFLFRPPHTMPPQAHDALMAKVTILPDRLEVRLLPLMLDVKGKPAIPTEREASWMLARLAELSAPLGARIEIDDGVGHITVRR